MILKESSLENKEGYINEYNNYCNINNTIFSIKYNYL